METQIVVPVISKPKDGALGIILIGGSDEEMKHDPLNQRFVIIQDKDDRGLGTGLPKRGIPGGGIEEKETPQIALMRELDEEIGFKFEISSLKQVGCFQKNRMNGWINDNYLFSTRLNYEPILQTNDPREVSKVHISPFWEIINFMRAGRFHEGSIRLLFHFLNGTKKGSLNDMVNFRGFKY